MAKPMRRLQESVAAKDKRPEGVKASEFASGVAKAIGDMISPVTKPLGQAATAMSPIWRGAEATGLVKPGTGGDFITNMIAGALNAPIDVAADLGVLTSGKSTLAEKAGAGVNTFINLGAPGAGRVFKAAKNAIKGGKQAEEAVETVAKASKWEQRKAAKAEPPKAKPPKTEPPKAPDVATEPKGQPKAGQEAKGGKGTGISHAEVEKLREEGLVSKPRSASTKTDKALFEEAKKHSGNEQSIANNITAKDSTVTLSDSEELALGSKLSRLVEDMRAAKAANDEEAFFKANADAEVIANALDESGSRQGRAFRARQFLFENEVDPWIVARKAKRAGASDKDVAKLTEIAEQNQKDIQEILPDWDPKTESIQTALNRKVAQDLEAAKAEAGIEVVIEGVKRKAGKRTAEAVRAEREAQSKLIKDLVKKTFKESIGSGLQSGGLQSFFENAPEVFRELRRYIELVIEERKIAKLEDLYQPAKEDIKKMLQEEMGDDLPEDFEVTDSDIRAIFAKFYDKTTNTPNAAKRQLEELRKQAGLVENIERVTGGLQPIAGKSPKAASREVQRLRKQLNDLLAQVGKAPAQEGVRTRLQNLIKKLEFQKASGQRPNPKEQAEMFKDLKSQISSLRRDMRLEDTIDDLETQIRENTFTPPNEKVVNLTKEQEKMQYRVEKLRGEVRAKLQAAQEPKGLRTAIEILNTPRTLLSTGDVSWIFRQAIKTTAANPRRAGRDLRSAISAGISEERAYKIMRDMEKTDSYRLADQAGIRFEDFRPGGVRNEAFLASWVGKFPVVGQIKRFSERNFVVGLNKARLGMFEDFQKRVPNATKDEMKTWARYINDATGSGELGKLEGAAADLAAAFFSPRLLASRIRSPLYVLNKDKNVRRRAISDVVKLAAAGNTAIAIAKAAGAETSNDPDDSDWGKIRVGNQATDIWGGYQQPARAAARLAKAIAERVGVIEAEKVKTGPNRGKDKTLDPWDLTEQYLSYKLAPGAQAGRVIFTGKNAVGEEQSLGDFIRSITLPLNVQGSKESAELNEWLSAKTGWSFLGNSIGFGVSTYEKKKERK
jgi:hypothetical protein